MTSATRRVAALWRGGRVRWVAAGALALGLLIACEFAGWPFLRGRMQAALADASGLPVRLEGDFRLRLLRPPGLRAGTLVVGAVHGPTVPFLIDARDFALDWRWRDLWRWRGGAPLRLQSVEARTLHALLKRDAQGGATWQLGRAEVQPLPQVGALVVDSGQIEFDDALRDAQLQIELRRGATPGGPDRQHAQVSGRYVGQPVDVQAHAGAMLPLLLDADAARGAPTAPLRVEGRVGRVRLDFDGAAGALFGAMRLDGRLALTGPSLAAVGQPLGVTLPRSRAFALNGRLGHDGTVWRLQAEGVRVGASRLGGDFRFDTAPKPPLLTGKLVGATLALADLGPAVGAPEDRPARRPGAAAQRVLPNREFDLPSLRAMDADVDVSIDSLDFGSEALAPFRALRTHLRLRGGVLHLESIDAAVAGGRLSGKSTLDGSGTPARWAADLRLSGVDVAEWIRAVRKPGTTAPQRKATATAAARGAEPAVDAYVTGRFQGALQARGSGRTTAEILATLDGRAQASVRDGSVSHLLTELAGLDIAQGLGVAVSGDHALAMRCAHVDLVLRQGVARTRTAVIDNRDSTVRIDGLVDLRNESLALRAEVQPKDFSPLSLRTPLVVSGTLAHPVVGVDAGPLVARLLAAAALGVLAAPAALLPLIDPGTGTAADPCLPATRAPTGAASAPSR